MDAYATATTTDGTAIERRIVSLPPTRSKERPSIIARASVSARCTISWSTSPPGELPCRQSFGGFLGMGESYHPLPWRVLNYDTRQGGFVIDLDRSRLEEAPSYTASNVPNWSDRTYGSRIDEFYGVPSYWTMI
jgi:hypothetical protein